MELPAKQLSFRQPRHTMRLDRKAMLALSAISNILKVGSGPIGALKKAARVFREKGWTGLKQRLFLLSNSNKFAYQAWIDEFDTLDEAARAHILANIENLATRPLISVLMPVFNPEPRFLDKAIASVRSQLYPTWELCIADDASTNSEIRKILEQHAAEESRIKLVFRERNGHISETSNSALGLAEGEFVALLDHDDILREHALYCVADTILAHPDAGLIYSDEDKCDEMGARKEPYFKSNYNPELLLFHNFICHLGVYRTSLVRELGGFRKGFEGAQDYDLALRCTERLTAEQIVHIPRVLYHWRADSDSTASNAGQKPYALRAGERALNEHFARARLSARAELTDQNIYRIHFKMPEPKPLVSIIIPTRNGSNLIKRCVDSIFDKSTYRPFEILVIDNGSDEPATLAYFREISTRSEVRILRDDRPFNYSALNNGAVRLAKGEFVCLMNNDTEVITPGWLEEMVGLAVQPRIGAVGARLWYPNNTLQHGGITLGINPIAGHSHKGLSRGLAGPNARAIALQTVSAVTGACLLVRKSIYEEVGGLDEMNLVVAYNDVDFCLKVREAGYRNVWTPHAELYHHEGASRGHDDMPEKRARFKQEGDYMRKRWADAIARDPYYSPNLTIHREDFSLAWPPRVEPL